MENKKRLTAKNEAFCHAYFACGGNATRAYREVYAVEGQSRQNAHRAAHRIMARAEVQARIAELAKEYAAAHMVTADRVISELASIAFSNMASIQDTWMTRHDFEELSADDTAAIKTIVTRSDKDGEYVKIELHDKMAALKQLSSMLGLDAPQKIEVNAAADINETHRVVFENYKEEG